MSDRLDAVVVPREDCRGAAIGAPGFGERAALFFGRAIGQPHDLADVDLDGEVARGPDVAPPLGEQQVDFGRPAADALDLGEQSDRIFVVGGQVVEGQRAGHDELGKAPRIALFLAAEPARAQGVEF